MNSCKMDIQFKSRQILIALLFCVFSGTGIHAQEPTGQKQTMLYWAEQLANHVNQGNTDYRHKDESVSWEPYQSYADCSGFINALIKKTFAQPDILKEWFGKSRPLAVQYYDAISNGHHFSTITSIDQILPGDLIVLKYSDKAEHDDNTGHCLLVEELPIQTRPVDILEPGSLQYAVRVIDSSRSPHGKNDTRHAPDGNSYAGLGKGTFRLYTDKGGKITGYSWSLGKPLPGFDPYTNAIIVGRMAP